MGYRALLKKYVRFLELNAGDNFIETIAQSPEPILSQRDLRELRTVAAEVFREVHEAPDSSRVENWNYRLRLLLNHHGLTTAQAALIAQVDEASIHSWRSQPRSEHYQRMSEAAYRNIERAIESGADQPAATADVADAGR